MSMLPIEEWITIVFAYAEQMTVTDLIGMNTDVAAAALAAPTATVAGRDLYPDIHAKASALLNQLLQQRPLSDEALNREVAVTTAMLILDGAGHAWKPNPQHLPYWVSEAARGRTSVETLTAAIVEDCTCPD